VSAGIYFKKYFTTFGKIHIEFFQKNTVRIPVVTSSTTGLTKKSSIFN